MRRAGSSWQQTSTMSAAGEPDPRESSNESEAASRAEREVDAAEERKVAAEQTSAGGATTHKTAAGEETSAQPAVDHDTAAAAPATSAGPPRSGGTRELSSHQRDREGHAVAHADSKEEPLHGVDATVQWWKDSLKGFGHNEHSLQHLARLAITELQCMPSSNTRNAPAGAPRTYLRLALPHVTHDPPPTTRSGARGAGVRADTGAGAGAGAVATPATGSRATLDAATADSKESGVEADFKTEGADARGGDAQAKLNAAASVRQPSPSPPPPPLPPPPPPFDEHLRRLKDHLVEGRVTIMAGAGMAKAINDDCPGWCTLLTKLGTKCADIRYDDQGEHDAFVADNITTPLAHGDCETPAHAIQVCMAALGHHNDYRAMVHHIFSRFHVPDDPPSPAAVALSNVVSFRAPGVTRNAGLPVLTVNYDTLLERGMSYWKAEVRRFPATHVTLMQQGRLKDFWDRSGIDAVGGLSLADMNVVHMHGLLFDQSDTQGFALTPLEYANQHAMIAFLRFLAEGLFRDTLHHPSSLLMVGCDGTVTDPHFSALWVAEGLLFDMGHFTAENPRPIHFLAFKEASLTRGDPSIADKLDAIFRLTGTRILPVVYPDHPDVPAFLQGLNT